MKSNDIARVGFAMKSPANPMFFITNDSQVVAKDPKFQLLLYDLDGHDDADAGGKLSLAIPAWTGDYISPKGALGPYSLLTRVPPDVRSRVVLGHRIFGFAQLQCSTCDQVSIYWIYINLGRDGWYARRTGSPATAAAQRELLLILRAPAAEQLFDQVAPDEVRSPL
jgi:hypothetical protein